MYQANLYTRHNGLQRSDLKKVLSESMQLIKWNTNGGDMVLDAGCGTGDVTRDVLLPQFPDFERIVGVDISADMLDYAKKHNSHAKIEYRLMDLADSASIHDDLVGRFDHAFSFHVVHWIKNQTQLFKNLHAMLKPGGDMLFYFVVSTDVKDIHEKMSRMRKWCKYINDLDVIFQYHHCEDPLHTLETLLSDTGFAHIIKIVKRAFVYDSVANFKTSMAILNPYLKNVPKHQHDEFMEDFVRVAKDLQFFGVNEEQKEIAVVPYHLAVIYMRKPEVASNTLSPLR